jgi:MFS superfamily sulfate permease-like transporter
VSFLNKGKILEMLRNIPEGANVTIDGRNSKTIHHDVVEILQDFQISAKSKNISLKLVGINFKNFK